MSHSCEQKPYLFELSEIISNEWITVEKSFVYINNKVVWSKAVIMQMPFKGIKLKHTVTFYWLWNSHSFTGYHILKELLF